MASDDSAKQPRVDYGRSYSADIETIRKDEYPLLNGKLSHLNQFFHDTNFL